MSITPKSIFAAQPATTRATPTHLSVDPKGERIAYASGKSVFLRSIDDPSVSRQYTAHTATATVARFSPSGFYVASGDVSGMVRVWDCAGEDMNTKGEFHIISGPIKDLAWDGESKRIIAVGEGKERYGHCITFDTGNSVGEISGHSSPINSVSIRQQRPYRAATASDDQTLAFFHGAPFKFATSLTGHHSNFVHGVAFSPDGEHLVSVGADRKIFLFDGKTGDFLAEFPAAHTGSIFSVSWAPDSKAFVTASADQTVKLWSVEKKECTHTWTFDGGLRDHQVGVVYTPRADGLVISLSLSGDLNYLYADSATARSRVTGHQKAITALHHAAADSTLLTGSYEGKVCKWDLASGSATTLSGETHTNTVTSFVSHPGGVASVGWDDKLRTLDLAAGKFLENVLPTEAQPVDVALLNGEHVVLATLKELRVYSAANPPALLSTTPLPFTPSALAASPATNHIAVASKDNSVHIYTLPPSPSPSTPPTLKTKLTANVATPTALSYSPSGAYLAAGDASGKIVLYAAGDDAYSVKTTRWAFHTARVERIDWNADGSHVVSASLDTNVFVYSVDSPMKKAAARNAHMGGVARVAWVRAGKQVVSAGADGTVKVWEVALP